MATKLWWMIQKDLLCEYRSRLVWPRMLLLGLVVAFLFGHQMDVPPSQLQSIAPSLCWLTICFAAVLTLGQSFTIEREDACWYGLRLYPVAPQSIYFSKLFVNVIALGGLQCVVVPLFAFLSDAAWLGRPGHLLLVLLLGNLGITSIGTLLGAMSSGMQQSQSLLALVLLPLLIPVILAASEATRLLAESHVEPAWWGWIQLLGAFAIVYLTAGWMLFEFVIED